MGDPADCATRRAQSWTDKLAIVRVTYSRDADNAAHRGKSTDLQGLTDSVRLMLLQHVSRVYHQLLDQPIARHREEVCIRRAHGESPRTGECRRCER